MRRRTTKWLLLTTLATSTLFLGCPATIGLGVLSSLVGGAYSGIESTTYRWAQNATAEFLDSLQQTE